ncbi:hypothetical protein HPB48_005965 [Haemaphysalis longicornis]|uniref:Uncharacterized protein n=1 Tax=Haemaphysalis longicornis TaxID=44386 RepID=A0A9J6FB41_HAELO|nr:hypothetical protein HPB48_005965 [Haemaphysalis longicornis]
MPRCCLFYASILHTPDSATFGSVTFRKPTNYSGRGRAGRACLGPLTSRASAARASQRADDTRALSFSSPEARWKCGQTEHTTSRLQTYNNSPDCNSEAPAVFIAITGPEDRAAVARHSSGVGRLFREQRRRAVGTKRRLARRSRNRADESLADRAAT